MRRQGVASHPPAARAAPVVAATQGRLRTDLAGEAYLSHAAVEGLEHTAATEAEAAAATAEAAAATAAAGAATAEAAAATAAAGAALAMAVSAGIQACAANGPAAAVPPLPPSKWALPPLPAAAAALQTGARQGSAATPQHAPRRSTLLDAESNPVDKEERKQSSAGAAVPDRRRPHSPPAAAGDTGGKDTGGPISTEPEPYLPAGMAGRRPDGSKP